VTLGQTILYRIGCILSVFIISHIGYRNIGKSHIGISLITSTGNIIKYINIYYSRPPVSQPEDCQQCTLLQIKMIKLLGELLKDHIC